MTVDGEIAKIRIGDSCPVKVVGIINCSPDSFYKPSIKLKDDEIANLALKLIEEGAEIIDVGAVSTAPPEIYGKPQKVSPSVEKEQITRAIPIIKDVTDAPISVDTQRAEVAEAALKLEASIVNDVSGLKSDPSMARVISEYGAATILMAAKEKPGDVGTVKSIIRELKGSISIALENEIDEAKIVIDPGIGFGKDHRLDLNIIKNLVEFRILRKPILISLSRKSFIGRVLEIERPEDLLVGSLAATAIAVYNGVHMIRTHDVGKTVEVVRVAEAIRDQTGLK
ncbi:MAG: dihydropteroate synthase [Candidatus Hodarchaeota archaeon]